MNHFLKFSALSNSLQNEDNPLPSSIPKIWIKFHIVSFTFRISIHTVPNSLLKQGVESSTSIHPQNELSLSFDDDLQASKNSSRVAWYPILASQTTLKLNSYIDLTLASIFYSSWSISIKINLRFTMRYPLYTCSHYSELMLSWVW